MISQGWGKWQGEVAGESRRRGKRGGEQGRGTENAIRQSNVFSLNTVYTGFFFRSKLMVGHLDIF